jgi:predicted HTH transcriptional regulator
VIEFKNVGDSYSTSDIGKYFSALANEANLRDAEKAWLVFGVDNKTRSIVGSDYRQATKYRDVIVVSEITLNDVPGFYTAFMFQLTQEEKEDVVANLDQPDLWGGIRSMISDKPYYREC